MSTMTPQAPVGDLIRTWRTRRRYSQLDLASEAAISQRHLSFVESGRAQPSRDMILRLSEHLEIPLRERNDLLLAGGFAPIFPEHGIAAPAMSGVLEAVQTILAGHEPHPALVVDRRWNLIAANRTASLFLTGIDSSLATPPVNLVRLSLHPRGLAPRILNLPEWRSHALERLRRQSSRTADPFIADLIAEVAAYPIPEPTSDQGIPKMASGLQDIFMPLVFRSDAGVISLLATTTVFGTATEITLSEMTLEAFYPADPASAAVIRALSAAPSA